MAATQRRTRELSVVAATSPRRDARWTRAPRPVHLRERARLRESIGRRRVAAAKHYRDAIGTAIRVALCYFARRERVCERREPPVARPQPRMDVVRVPPLRRAHVRGSQRGLDEAVRGRAPRRRGDDEQRRAHASFRRPFKHVHTSHFALATARCTAGLRWLVLLSRLAAHRVAVCVIYLRAPSRAVFARGPGEIPANTETGRLQALLMALELHDACRCGRVDYAAAPRRPRQRRGQHER